MSASGGEQLRALRRQAGKTQLETELDANLGTGYLQRVEAGKVERPERETLERILAALGARYSEQRQILETFGYVVKTPLPAEDEIQWALAGCRDELNGVLFPAYLLDCAHRLLAWNRFTNRLFNQDMAALARLSALRLLFDPQYGIVARLHNPEAFYPATIRALRHEMQSFRHEDWYRPLIDELTRLPLFKQYWQAAGDYIAAARPLVPIVFTAAHDGLLTFRLTSETFTQDSRFRMIYYLPADAPTLQQCSQWAETDRA